MEIQLICFLLMVSSHLVHALVRYSDVESWSYTDKILGPADWGDEYPLCKNGLWQSPIDIPFNTTSACLQPIQWMNLDHPRPQTTFQNAWRSIKPLLSDSSNPLTIRGGPLPIGEAYYFSLSTLRVGADGESGSQHSLRGRNYPGEWSMQFTNNPNITTTNWETAESIVILSFFIDISEYDNPNWDVIIRRLPSIMRAGSNATVDIPSVRSLLPQYQEWETDFFMYIGSVAVPPCIQPVTRVIYATPINLSSRQINAFRNVCDEFGSILVDNKRPLQTRKYIPILRSKA